MPERERVRARDRKREQDKKMCELKFLGLETTLRQFTKSLNSFHSLKWKRKSLFKVI